MRGLMRVAVTTVLAVCGLAAAMTSVASAATLQETTTTAFQAVYGNPPSSTPAGYGLARNFGFGTNVLFEANATSPRKMFSFTIGGFVSTSSITEFGGTLQSNKTGANTPLGVAFQFADFQKAAFDEEAAPWFSDTNDRPWITTICAPASATCKTDPSFTGPAGGLKIEDVSLNIGPGFVLQGTLWGKWSNGTATTPPCIAFEAPPTGATASQTLIVTQTPGTPFPAVGASITAVSGTACLVSANNYYYPGKTPEIKIANE